MDVKAAHQAAKEFYWKDKDLGAARQLLEEGIVLARTQGHISEEKAMNYNLASFCWPGWDEPGIKITSDDLQAGERAAAENLRLAEELEKGDGPLGNAWFMVGAYHLAFGRLEAAKVAFGEYRGAAIRAGLQDHVLLASGYTALVIELQKGNVDVRLAAQTIQNESGENGPEFAEQLRTAARVFAP